MNILAIETSCDETGVAIIDVRDSTTIVRANTLASQIEIHAPYGGVFPALAKRAHAEKITTLLIQALSDAELLEPQEEMHTLTNELAFLSEKESVLQEHLLPFFSYYKKPDIAYIAVTVGPGLEPALWVGVNTARALSIVWDIPIIPINHMEGHIIAAAVEKIDEQTYKHKPLAFPALSLLVSGGHTELVHIEHDGQYKKIGQTRDDAVGEAFDKVARMFGLAYPGGPIISKLAREWRERSVPNIFELPRPMMYSGDFDFSFSGIKTATLYAICDYKEQHGDMNEEAIAMLATAFEDAVVDVLVHKTYKAIDAHGIETVIVGGGVAGNTHLQEVFTKKAIKSYPNLNLLFPEPWLATDNALMIALAAANQVLSEHIKTAPSETLRADGNLSI